MKQYLKLLMVREGKEVLGKKGSNLWILTLVLVATFTSIAFSEGSIIYLKDKMEDPFTMWIDIPIDGNKGKFERFVEELNDSNIQRMYGFRDVHGDRQENYDMQRDQYLRCRHFANMHAPLIRKILEGSNLVKGCVIDSAKLSNNSLGVFITEKALKRLGYHLDSIPSYIYYKAYNPSADTLGLKLQEGKFLLIPWPLLAVVRRLPNNMDMMGTNYLSEQPFNDIKYPFDFNVHTDYLSILRYFAEGEVDLDSISNEIRKVFPDTIASSIHCIEEENDQMIPWKPGKFIKVDFGQEEPNYSSQQWLAFNDVILKRCKYLTRIYFYDTGSINNIPNRYISLTFSNLDNIRAFEDYANNVHKIQIDMSLVASKENFNAVSRMAQVLSAAMVIFSIVCIIMFLVNMLQSYFQKVKRNLGTFKAFGMKTRELTKVYILILITIVLAAVIMALMITWATQGILHFTGVEKDGFNYLSLWNITTYVATAVILVSTILTVIVVMTRMMRQTPGDLIYDR